MPAAEPSGLTPLTLGVFQGAVYGLLAVGLVLVYKGVRVFNFAQGEFGTVATFVAFGLIQTFDVPYGVAFLGGLVAAVLIGLLMERLVIRPLFDAPRITMLVATVGFALFLIAVVVIVGKPETRAFPPLVGSGAADELVVIFGAAITPQQILIVGVLGALAVVLALFFRTNLGLAVLALSQDPLATRIMGISVVNISRLIWAFAALLGGLAGLLLAGIPGRAFAPGFMTSVALVPAFAAAVLGGMTSLPGAFIGGILVGIGQALGEFYIGDAMGVPGASELTVFLMLLLVLLIRPRGLLGTEA